MSNFTFTGNWSVENTENKPTFDNDVFSAIVAGQNCAIARKDKRGIEFFKGIAKKGNIANLTSQDQSLIRIWYMRSLES